MERRRLRYYLYARKSTDAEDRQVLSVGSQLDEGWALARRDDLDIVKVFIEKQSAKSPGRAEFNKIIDGIRRGDADGIISWLPDRLSRNPVDSGLLLYLLDEGILVDLKFPRFWFENTPQGKYMLSLEFSQSKHFVDNLSENVKRGLRTKVRRGEMPGIAPIGYINNKNTKRIVLDRRVASKITEAFKLYAQGDKTMSEISQYLYDNGVKTDGRYNKRKGAIKRGGNKIKDDRIKKILKNPFYYGYFMYNDELHKGEHTTIISKSLYDKCQRVMERRGHAQPTAAVRPVIPFLGLLRCSCGMGITAETKTRTQKNGNHHEWTYYRCSRKNKAVECSEPAVREAVLWEQLSALLLDYSLPSEAVAWLLDKIEADERAESSYNLSAGEDLRRQVADLTTKQKLLLDSYLDQVIDRQTFTEKKAELMSQKATFDEQLARLERGGTAWIEPMRRWVLIIGSICKIVDSRDFDAQKALLLEIFGSNLLLKDKNVVAFSDGKIKSPPETAWSALRAANPKAARAGDLSEFFSNLAGMEGFEPPNAWTRTTCLTTWRHPIRLTNFTTM